MIFFDNMVYANPETKGKLSETPFEGYGLKMLHDERYSNVYYLSGIKELDDILQGKHISQKELVFLPTSFTNAFVFLVMGIKGKDAKMFGVWRDKIKDFTIEKNVTITTLDVNLQSKNFAAGKGAQGGFVGGLITSAVGQIVDKLTGIQLKEEEGAIFLLNFIDENNNIHTVKFSTPRYFIDKTEDFLNRNFTPNAPIKKIEEESKGGCYIATSCYKDYESKEVLVFRRFRDEVLAPNPFGRNFIKFYYFVLPTIAKWLDNKPYINNLVKEKFLDKIYQKLK